MAHCTNSDFAAADITAGATNYTHWAYDAWLKRSATSLVRERRGANYVLYAMEDPACEKAREVAALGCEQRRCDESQSTHNKICTAATQCTLDECEHKCKDHTDFTCSTYSYDAALKKCYPLPDVRERTVRRELLDVRLAGSHLRRAARHDGPARVQPAPMRQVDHDAREGVR